LLVKFHQTLSEETVYYRYFSTLKLSQRIAHERLLRICFIDYDREIALVAEYKADSHADPEILGVGRLSKLRGDNDAEFALVISDAWHRLGLGAKRKRFDGLSATSCPRTTPCCKSVERQASKSNMMRRATIFWPHTLSVREGRISRPMSVPIEQTARKMACPACAGLTVLGHAGPIRRRRMEQNCLKTRAGPPPAPQQKPLDKRGAPWIN
jgi:hypothetical protein